MRFKLIAGGATLFGLGALWGWAITGDRMEETAKSKQAVLADIIVRRTNEAEAAKAMLIDQPIIQHEDRPESSSEKIARLVEAHADEELILPDDVAEEVSEAQLEEFQERRLDEQLRGETTEETRSRLQGLIDNYVGDEDAQAFAKMAANVVETPVMLTPFVIPRETFAWDEEGEHYAKDTLTWYPRDRILLDEEEEPIDNADIDSVVGWGNLRRFGDDSGDVDTVYVRNRRLEKDFEVVREQDDEPPAHVRHNLHREEYRAREAAGTLVRFRRDDI